MRLVDFFKEQAAGAADRLEGLTDRRLESLDQQKQFDAIEARLTEMEADGVIDPEELAEIRRRVVAAGGDPTELDTLSLELFEKDAASSAARSPGVQIRDAVAHQRQSVKSDEAELTLATQEAVDDYASGIQFASALLKNEHDTYMNVIRNLQA